MLLQSRQRLRLSSWKTRGFLSGDALLDQRECSAAVKTFISEAFSLTPQQPSLCAVHHLSEVDTHVLMTMASHLQSHKVTLQRKLQERQGDLQSKQQLLAAVEKVGASSTLAGAHSSRCLR